MNKLERIAFNKGKQPEKFLKEIFKRNFQKEIFKKKFLKRN